MDINIWMEVITNFGFPVCVCLIAFWYIKYMDDKNSAERKELMDSYHAEIRELRESHKTETEKLTEALQNNTIAITKLCEKIDREDETC